MRHLVITTLFILLLSIPVLGQSGLERQEEATSADAIGKARIDNKFSLLDLSRLDMSHSYTISYFSANGQGTTIGMYMNSIRYRISNPLTLNVNLAWVHQPGQLLGGDRGTPTDYGSIYPSFSLEYRPSDKFYLEIGYHSVPAYMYYYNTDRMRRNWFY
ncbi:MAG TPA: hypothetical protein ENO22_07675 [candidate division Zixibacteria bacterium]|nr:hypothetical protein [candidate division Zixibacteria bacterium]HEQ99202.1 hypothetical protein [candidate division Zixibacteria bacterium]